MSKKNTPYTTIIQFNPDNQPNIFNQDQPQVFPRNKTLATITEGDEHALKKTNDSLTKLIPEKNEIEELLVLLNQQAAATETQEAAHRQELEKIMAEYEKTEKTSITEAAHRQELEILMAEFETKNTTETTVLDRRKRLLDKYAASNNKGRSI
jgi:hypothetical protein